ncbi:MAG: Gfo/Idh/MocA family protein [Tepidisphaeraceae bacterium]
MSQSIRLAVVGAGATGRAHATAAAGSGFKLTAVADSIPERLKALADALKAPATFDVADALFADTATAASFDAVCICLPTHLHVPVALAALKAGKHVLIEFPPAPTTKEAKTLLKAAEKANRVVLYSAVRRFGAAEQSAKQAIEKGYVGPIYHARATVLRTRGVPYGTGWYHDPEKTGGGAIIDLALPMIDLIDHLITPVKPASVYATAHSNLTRLPVEEAGSVLVKFDNGGSAEVSCAWAMNQPPSQAGTVCRLSGEAGSVDVYTPQGPVVYRGYDEKGNCRATPLKQPKIAGYSLLMRHFRDCILGNAKPLVGAAEGVHLMAMAEAIYKSVATGKAVEL